MATLISKVIPHNHSGYGSGGICYQNGSWYDARCSVYGFAHGHYGPNGDWAVGTCTVCGNPIVKGPVEYGCSCSASNCATVSVDYTNGVLRAYISATGNDTGVKNVSYKWIYKGAVVSTSSSYTPAIDGYYSLVVNCNDSKVNDAKTVTLDFKVDYVANWDNVYVGGIKIYGIAIGDTPILGAAVGSVIL